MLARAAAALRPGGTILVVAHHLAKLTEGSGGPSRADVLCTEADVAADLSGSRVARAERVTRPSLDGEGPEAVDLLVRAVRPI